MAEAAPTTLVASATLAGMTRATFDAAAQTTFRTEVANLLSGKTMTDVTITDVEEMARRRRVLLAAHEASSSGLKVNYEVPAMPVLPVGPGRACAAPRARRGD
eukprot:417568-Rhodomonas_salina.1